MASMGLAIQATREFQENQDKQDILANVVAPGFPGSVTFPCVIRPTISGNITAKGPMSDDTGMWGRLLYISTPKWFKEAITVSLTYRYVCDC